METDAVDVNSDGIAFWKCLKECRTNITRDIAIMRLRSRNGIVRRRAQINAEKVVESDSLLWHFRQASSFFKITLEHLL